MLAVLVPMLLYVTMVESCIHDISVQRNLVHATGEVLAWKRAQKSMYGDKIEVIGFI